MSVGYKRFMLLWAASLISTVGSGMTSFGLGVYVFEETGRAAATGLILLAGFLPGLLLSPFAGVLADRFDRRWLMIVGDGCSALGLICVYIALVFDAGIGAILFGVAVSSAFSSLTEPAFRSTVSDLLDRDEYTRASGMVQLTSAARFLISPPAAGVVLRIWDISALLMIDISTILLTVTAAFIVRKAILSSSRSRKTSLLEDFREGFDVIYRNGGLWTLVLTASVMSLFFGVIQVLSTPMILSFADPEFLGMALSISSSGILVISFILGVVPIRNHFHRILSLSLFCAGIFMSVFGLRENKTLICVFGFLLFSMLPLCNISLDYLVRTNVREDVQGRVWGLIGIISQLGYVAAYAVVGQVADHVFVPLLKPGGALSKTFGAFIGVGEGRGFGLLIILSGLLLSLTALILNRNDAVRKLEKPCISN